MLQHHRSRSTNMEKDMKADGTAVYYEENGHFDRSWRDENWNGRALSVAAQDVTNDEKAMSIWEAIQANKKAIAWSLVISTCVIMEGFDTK